MMALLFNKSDLVYGELMDKNKALLFATIIAAFAVFSTATLIQIVRRASPIAIQTQGFPSIGKAAAPVEVVLIEDFQCKNCRSFSKKVLPKLQSKYVKEGKVRFVLVPVSFLTGSQAIANAVLEVYHQNPRQFFPYLKDVLIHEGEVKVSDLLRLANRVQGIDMEKLRSCIENGCHNQELEKNLGWAQRVMGSQFRTPALYVNGAAGSTYSFEAIQYQIDLILGKGL